ncbi:MAG: Rpn family recombination-promoting nuclease/putative transposase [Moorea sp. SIO1G6]|uniref:Rpn family recombination-promoting nuclease/putative transposase n=1 Tax=Moorena sp. SIO1G6 TaxID=2607840 RepID=UPI0013C2537F|nr:Rpn family recombination-promoting nuclease/putative transposase [Moorena sp. SIO1G6]NET66352.1 Rpn family recombination-promoting nuclease/putative transposase [Moorena sp. SIO1G6]
MKFISPKTDFAFKKIFASQESKPILISFLNALVYHNQPLIQDLEIIDPYQSSPLPILKDSFLDVKAKLRDGSLVIIEMQVLQVESFARRVLYNAAKAYSLQLGQGEGYRSLKPVIALTITDFIMFPENNQVINHFEFREKSTNISYVENYLQLLFVELPKFEKQLEELEDLDELWMYFLKNAPSLDTVPDKMAQLPEFQQAFGIASQANLTRKELDELGKREMFIHDQQGLILFAEKQGREKGMKQGIEEGMKQGREEGEKEKAQTIARQLLPLLDDETISQTTGIPVEEIRKLR